MSCMGAVAIVSEQVVPVVLHLWHLRKTHQESLRQVVLLHTSDETRSKNPAERIRALWKAHFPDTPCRLCSVGILPQDVREAIRQVQDEHPELVLWKVNMTGGLKTMVLGAADLVGEEGIEVVYLERGAGWFALTRQAGKLRADRRNGTTWHDAASDLTPVEIATVQLGELEHREEKKLPWSTLRQEAAKLADAVAENGGDWSPVQERLGGGGAGVAFEALLAASLAECGLGEPTLQLVSRLPKSKEAFFESDVALWRNGQLWIFDLSLNDGKGQKRISFGKHVRLAAETQRRLGGLDAQWVIVRPTRRLSSKEREEAETVKIRRIFDGGKLGGLLPQAARWLGGSVPSELECAFVRLSRALTPPG